MSGELDMRKMGGLKKHMPITYWTFLIASLAIAGIFPFAGFFSKDEILFHSLVDGHLILLGHRHRRGLHHRLLMFRVVFMTFYGKSRVAPRWPTTSTNRPGS